MRFLTVLLVFIGAFLVSGPGHAEESLIRPGQTVLNISATERQAVDQDLLMASLRYESEGKDSKVLQNEINTLMKKALEEAGNFDKVKVMTDNYYVYPYDPNQREHPDPEERIQDVKKHIRLWRGSQGMQISSMDSESLLKLMGKLQSLGFQASNLTYTLSPETFEKVRDSMMEGALAKLTERANRAAKALGKNGAELVEVNVDSGYPVPIPMMARADMMGMADAKVESPSADPGETEILLTVNARAILK